MSLCTREEGGGDREREGRGTTPARFLYIPCGEIRHRKPVQETTATAKGRVARWGGLNVKCTGEGGRGSIVRSFVHRRPGEKRRAWSKNVKCDSPPAFLLYVCNPSLPPATPSCRDTPSLVHDLASLFFFFFLEDELLLSFLLLPFSFLTPRMNAVRKSFRSKELSNFNSSFLFPSLRRIFIYFLVLFFRHQADVR